MASRSTWADAVRAVLPDLVRALDEDGSVVLATVVGTWGSAPQPAGAAMLRRLDGRVVGSISGGCVEGATYELAEQVQDTGEPVRCRFDVSDDDAIAVGLTCGGTIEVHVERVDVDQRPLWTTVLASVRDGRTTTIVSAPPADGAPPAPRILLEDVALDGVDGWDGDDLARVSVAASAGGGLVRLGHGPTGPDPTSPDPTSPDPTSPDPTSPDPTSPDPTSPDPTSPGREAFVSVLAAAPRLLVYGAVDFAAALCDQVRLLGYRTTVCDARAVFATSERFPSADEVVVDWPHRHLEREVLAGRTDGRTVVCVLTHDEKFDLPLLTLALTRDDLGYVGAMGSARTHHRRVASLADAGVPPERVARLHSPIGLHLGGRTPAETALAIAAEVTASRHGASMQHLRGAQTPIHGRATPAVGHLRPAVPGA
ncbi:hypothetical protein ASF38_02790 [Aeromicrobium sp. Leaf272]|nr:hypothetical protein ASF38_02790 [Aeromicrobium sp. Leaf272]